MATKKKSLLELAVSSDPGRGVPGPEALASQEDRVSLAVAYLEGEVTGKQVRCALKAAGYKIHGGNFGTVMSQAVWTGLRQGLLKVTRVK